LFERFLWPVCEPGAHVLDLCCGAGHFTAWLEERGYRATGVDASRSMLVLAAAKTRKATFVQADMSRFELPDVCDAAVCFYNSLNQALTPAQLRDTLCSVRRHLREGGVFLFDFVAAEGYEETWNGGESVTCGDRTCTVRYDYHAEQQIAVCRIDVKSHVDYALDQPSREFYQRPWSLTDLTVELTAAGFRIQSVERAQGPADPPDGRTAIAAIAIPV
jgi:SAM-dependent methyltransferase